MPRKVVRTVNSILKGTQSFLNTHYNKEQFVPDIVTFLYDPAYLALKNRSPEITLYPVQELILKCFYRGTLGNENLQITDEEIALCESLHLDSRKNGNILKKWDNGKLFTELVLVWGRRSGKDFTISVIALYEAMKLLESPGGDPYAKYKLSSANPFTILTIANSQSQARILYNEIRDKFMSAPYFRDKFNPDGLTMDSIWMLTPKDKKDNEEFAAKGWPQKLGSIRVLSGHSNSDSLLGLGCFVLLLDEVASFKTTAGSASGDRIYTALTPTIKTYARREPLLDATGSPVLDDKGQPRQKSVYDGKVVSISSPRGMDGVFYNLYDTGDAVDERLVCRLPTWDVAATVHDYDSLRDSEPQMTDERFMMEYGAEFSGTAGENFFVPGCIERCFAGTIERPFYIKARDSGEPGVTYFAHLDPALSNHNYALCVVHKHYYFNRELRQVDWFIAVDHVKIWTPVAGKPIQISEVDDYMLWLNRRFHLGVVTYDQWNSQQSIEKLRHAGIPAKETRFSKHYKIQIYEELEALVNDDAMRLRIPQGGGPESSTFGLLKNEMLHLQRRYMNSGFRIYAKTEGEVKTDDCCDALAAACFNALQQTAQRLPRAQLVNTGSSPTSNARMWQSMQGVPYGKKDLDLLSRITKFGR